MGGMGGGRFGRPSSGGGDKDKGGRGGDKEKGKRYFFRRRKVCKFCSEKIDYIDYKDVRLLMQFVPERGKIQPRRLSGTSAKWQRKLQVALKRARELALIPYATD
jgi:small subunit ribosomal protein S18